MSTKRLFTVVSKSSVNVTHAMNKKNNPGWWVIGFAWLFYLYEYVLRVAPSVIEKQLMIDFQTTAVMIGTISGAYYWSYVPLQVPCGIIADKLGPRRVIALSSLLCFVGCLFFSFKGSLPVIIFGRFLMGAGSACAYICCTKVAATWFSKDKFPLLAGLTMFMGTLGGSFNTLFALLVEYVKWRPAILIFGIMGLFICLFAWFLMRDDPLAPKISTVKAPVTPSQTSMLTGLKFIASNPQNWLLGLYGCTMYLPLCAVAELWGVPFLVNMYDLTPKEASRAFIGVFIGMGLGSISSAWLSNVLQTRTKVMAWAAMGTLVCFSIVFFVPNIPLLMLCALLFLGGLLSGGQTLYFTAAKEQTPSQYSATAVGFINALVMSSAFIFQPLLGKILDLTWTGTVDNLGVRIYTIENYQTAFLAVSAAVFVGWLSILCVRDTYHQQDTV